MFRFGEIIELWRSDNLLTQAMDDSHTMLESTREMFRESVRSLRQSDDGEMGVDIYEQDQRVNRYEREVRNKVLKHLAITGGANIIPGLILTSIVIDIERIGDYTKNIKDLAVAHPKLLTCGIFEDDMKKIEQGVDKLFEQAIPALKKSDKATASKLIADNWWMLRKCDEMLDDLIQEKDPALGSGAAVSTAMYGRFLKRIAAHLINMLTSVVNPFEGIGFHGEDET
jgi:phosphate uptake regulator